MKSLSRKLNEALTEAKQKKSVEQLAIEYIIGKDIERYHDEANVYAYQLPKSSKWLTIDRTEVNDVVAQHGKSLLHMNESVDTVNIEYYFGDKFLRSEQTTPALAKIDGEKFKRYNPKNSYKLVPVNESVNEAVNEVSSEQVDIIDIYVNYSKKDEEFSNFITYAVQPSIADAISKKYKLSEDDFVKINTSVEQQLFRELSKYKIGFFDSSDLNSTGQTDSSAAMSKLNVRKEYSCGNYQSKAITESVNEAKTMTFNEIVAEMMANDFKLTKLNQKKYEFIAPKKNKKATIEHIGRDTVRVTDMSGSTDWSFTDWADELPMFQFENLNEAAADAKIFSEFSDKELSELEKEWEKGSPLKAINIITNKLHKVNITGVELSKQDEAKFDELYDKYLTSGRKKAATTLIAIYKIVKSSSVTESMTSVIDTEQLSDYLNSVDIEAAKNLKPEESILVTDLLGNMVEVTFVELDKFEVVYPTVDVVTESAVKPSDLKPNETYFVAYKDMEAFAEYKGKSGKVHQFDNSGRIIELTDDEVKKHVTNESVTEARVSIRKLVIEVTPKTAPAAEKLLKDNSYIKYDNSDKSNVFVFTNKDFYKDAVQYMSSDEVIEIVDKQSKQLADAMKQDSINMSVYGALAVNFKTIDDAIEAVKTDKDSVVKKVVKSLSHNDITKDEIVSTIDSIAANHVNEAKSKYEIEVSVKTAKLANDILRDNRNLNYTTDGSNYFIFRNRSEYDEAFDILSDSGVEILESASKSSSTNEAYTLNRAISDYMSEIHNLLVDKGDGVKTVSTRTYDLTGGIKAKRMSIDDAIDMWQKKLDELESGKVNPEDYKF